MSQVKVTQVVEGMQIGEGPHWVTGVHSYLLFVDIPNCDIHRYFPETKRHQVLHVDAGEAGSSISFVIPVEGSEDLFVISLGLSIVVVQWSVEDPDHHKVKAKAILHTVDAHRPTNRFNDGKCDPNGRLWAGTMSAGTDPVKLEMHQGNLYSLHTDLSISHQLDKISLSNGLAWSSDHTTFYYIDSCAYSIDAFDYNLATGSVGNRRKVLDFKEAGLQRDIPDGMCIDEQGNLWVACFNGGKVICIDPKAGKILRTITLPTLNTTSVCWGGPDLTTLYVTSARVELTEAELASQPAGATFAITGLGVKGLPSKNFHVDLELFKKRLS